MTVRMDGSFIDYVDYFDVTQEALETAPRKLFAKMMRLLLNKFHDREVAVQRLALELDEAHHIPVDDLDEFYDTMLETIDTIKLLKKKIEKLRKKDILFEELYGQADKLHTALTTYMDRMGQLEIRILQENQQSA